MKQISHSLLAAVVLAVMLSVLCAHMTNPDMPQHQTGDEPELFTGFQQLDPQAQIRIIYALADVLATPLEPARCVDGRLDVSPRRTVESNRRMA